MSRLDDLLADLTSGVESRAEAAVPQIVQMGESTLPALKALLASHDPDQRWWAVRTLAQMPNATAELFLEKLDDKSVEVRQAAALALAAHSNEESILPLIQALDDEDQLVVTLAANALVKIGKPAVTFLMDTLSNSTSQARIQMMRILAEIRDPRSIPAMMKALSDESALLNHWAEEGLERLGLDMVYIKLG